MTRSIDSLLKAHFATETTSIATLWKITRRDGVVQGFTDHDQDITYDGTVYAAATGFTPSDIDLKSDFGVSNLEVDGILDSSAITDAELMAGLYDYAEIIISLINYSDTSQGTLITKRGYLGEITMNRNNFTAEVRGLSQCLQQNFVELYSPTCRANLGDARCGVDVAAFTGGPVTITTLIDGKKFETDGVVTDATWFRGGKVLWLTGDNAGLESEVKEYTAEAVLVITLDTPYTVAVGDTFNVIAGCDKVFTTCKGKFNNALNFRGEPHIAGQDAVFTTAGTFQ